LATDVFFFFLLLFALLLVIAETAMVVCFVKGWRHAHAKNERPPEYNVPPCLSGAQRGQDRGVMELNDDVQLFGVENNTH
jgi:hypothetical protein